MKIDGLATKLEPIMEEVWVGKLKDREGRNAVEIDFNKISRPLTEALALYVVKVQGENNKIKILVKWKPKIDRSMIIPKRGELENEVQK